MNTIYDEENQIEDLNNEADRIIAMNPSGIIEKYDNREENNKKYKCIGDTCVILGDNEDCEDGICGIKNETNLNNVTKYIFYFIIFLVLCALGYFFYKKYKSCDS